MPAISLPTPKMLALALQLSLQHPSHSISQTRQHAAWLILSPSGPCSRQQPTALCLLRSPRVSETAPCRGCKALQGRPAAALTGEPA